jgi:hypothetical protein
MGVSTVPPAPTDESYRSAFSFAGQAGEVVLIQRAPPWAEFVPGGSISSRTERLTRLERDLAGENDLRLFLAIDPTDPADRGMLAALPPDLAARDFSDERIRAAFVAYAKYLALNYKPEFMALGVEVDMFYNRRGDGPFRNFQSLYFEAYDAVKSESPGTRVFPTFQLENLQGVVATNGAAPQPTWALINRFEPKIDMLAVSSFPGFLQANVDSIPADYYTALTSRTDKPIALMSVGWRTLPTAENPLAGEGDQARFVELALSQAEGMKAALVVWYLGRDLLSAPGSAFDPLASTGLHRADGNPKASWFSWLRWSSRPPPP